MSAKIYVAGPLTKGDYARNVRNAYKAAEDLAEHGFAPYVPHSTHLWDLIFPHTYEFWMSLDFEFLAVCDALLRLPGESLGADREVERAHDLNIPVFNDINGVVYHFNGNRCAPCAPFKGT